MKVQQALETMRKKMEAIKKVKDERCNRKEKLRFARPFGRHATCREKQKDEILETLKKHGGPFTNAEDINEISVEERVWKIRYYEM